jgi:hypothetical protein
MTDRSNTLKPATERPHKRPTNEAATVGLQCGALNDLRDRCGRRQAVGTPVMSMSRLCKDCCCCAALEEDDSRTVWRCASRPTPAGGKENELLVTPIILIRCPIPVDVYRRVRALSPAIWLETRVGVWPAMLYHPS